MIFPEKIDLHMHTLVSDGTDSPETLLMRVREAGLDMFSLTDHDAVKGCRILQALRTAEDPLFVTGVEFSCKDEEGKYHILGYGYDPDSASMQQVVAAGHAFRMKKVLARLDYLKAKFGITFPDSEIEGLMALNNPGKPHIGNLMVKYGFAGSKDAAIRDFINGVRFPGEYVRPEEAIRGILGGGGIPVLAHPAYGDGDQIIVGEAMDLRLRRLMDFGLQGVEAYYSGFTPVLRKAMLAFAEKYGLYVTAGSDYHGQNKMIELGDTGLERVSDGPSGLRKFIRKMLENGSRRRGS